MSLGGACLTSSCWVNKKVEVVSNAHLVLLLPQVKVGKTLVLTPIQY
jgi:hypothetical protein